MSPPNPLQPPTPPDDDHDREDGQDSSPFDEAQLPPGSDLSEELRELTDEDYEADAAEEQRQRDAIEDLRTPAQLATDQSTAPPINFDFVRRASRRGASEKARELLNELMEHFVAWDRAAVAVTVEQHDPPLCGPITWEWVRGYVRGELTEELTQYVCTMSGLSEAWEIAIEAAELEFAALGK